MDVLVNNAALMAAATSPSSTPTRSVTSSRSLNLGAALQLCRQVLPGMLERGRGRIVNVSSIAGVAAFPGMATYAATKAGLSKFTETLALDLRGLPVGTTLVELGPIPTDMLDHVDAYNPARLLRPGVPAGPDRRRPPRAGGRRGGVRGRADRAHVRLPKRAVAYPLMTQLPRELTRLILTGIRHRREP